MSRITIRRDVVLVLLIALVSFPSWAMAEDSADEVRTALESMHKWVGSGSNGQQWRKHLRSEELEAELAAGEKADLTVVAEILKKYQADTAGLDQARFVAVRDALVPWVEELTILNLPSKDELGKAAEEAKSLYTPVTEESVAQAKAGFASAAAKLDSYLSPGGRSSAWGNAWKKYLIWETLQEQLKDDSEADLAKISELYQKLTADHEGLEMSQFGDVAGALRRYADFVVAAKTKDVTKQYEGQLDKLKASLKKYAKQPNEEENANIGQILGWLQGTNQAETLIRAVRTHHSHPNLKVEISAALAAVGINKPVKKTTPITDNILGTSISGTGQTTGKVELVLVPSKHQAILETVLSGRTASRTTGYNGPVTLYSSGITTFTARKRTLVDKFGFHSQPATASARSNNNVNNISAGAVASRVAWDRIAQSRSEANRIASRHAEARVSEQFNREASPLLAKADTNFQKKYRHPMLRRRAFPDHMKFSTTKDAVHVSVLQATRFQLGAPDEAPTLKESGDLAVRVHESMANNMAAAVLAGQTLNDEDMREIAINVNGTLPEEMKNDQDEDPWSITFARRKPVTVIFADNGYSVTIRGRRFTSGDRKFNAMNISAKYKIERTATGSKLLRQGDIAIEPPGFKPNQKLSLSQISLRTILEKKFAKVFKEEIISDGLELKGNWKKAGKLRAVEIASDGGWLRIAWRMPSKDKVAAQKDEASTK